MTDTPVTLDEAKAWCRIDTTDDDTTVAQLINVASAYIETASGVVCATASRVFQFDRFCTRLPLYRAPINSITTVYYTASDGTETLLASNQYRLRYHLGVATLQTAYGVTFPDTECVDGAVTVTVSAGYASNAAVPEPIRTAALLLVAFWYDNRATVIVGQTSKELEFAVSDLLRPYRLQVLG